MRFTIVCSVYNVVVWYAYFVASFNYIMCIRIFSFVGGHSWMIIPLYIRNERSTDSLSMLCMIHANPPKPNRVFSVSLPAKKGQRRPSTIGSWLIRRPGLSLTHLKWHSAAAMCGNCDPCTHLIYAGGAEATLITKLAQRLYLW